ncbi:MAG: UbiA family prenyltransferase [Candidatus Eisenbacteria bacterium]|uniref:4-hydroxybenzoate polyprenyltransferase n=1 Tax=Eiseniibacteriota bacterium TaxID=2212470 RepID=A0A7Y2E7H5_UNCEI|nr:UbiA family prenyltransferase [Candidatus Eisenbacteria bacterium]
MPARGIGEGVLQFGRMIRFSHSIFSLPFAVSAVLFAVSSGYAWPTWMDGLWILVAAVAARTAAMTFNRIADRQIDAANPRTENRELPAGVISTRTAMIFLLLAAAVFVFAAGQLNPLCGWLSPLALFILFFYSYTKRFTWACHFFLGLSLAVAPVGGWFAVTGQWSWVPFLLGAGVCAWIAGMDILYALQDEAFDRRHGIHSIPARFGKPRSLAISALLHGLCIVLFLAFGALLNVHPAYFIGVLVAGGLLLWEQRVVRGTMERMQFVFFDMNGLFSLTFLAASALGVFL